MKNKRNLTFRASPKRVQKIPKVSDNINLDKLTEGDPDPFYFSATFINEVPGGKLSKEQVKSLPNRYQFKAAVVRSLANQFHTKGYHGFKGHIDNCFGGDGGWRDTAVYWVAGEYEDGSAVAYGYIPNKDISEDIKRSFAVNNPYGVSMVVDLDYEEKNFKEGDKRWWYYSVTNAVLNGIDFISPGYQADQGAKAKNMEVSFMDEEKFETFLETFMEEKIKGFIADAFDTDQMKSDIVDAVKTMFTEQGGQLIGSLKESLNSKEKESATLQEAREYFRSQLPEEMSNFSDLIAGDNFESLKGKYEDLLGKFNEIKSKKQADLKQSIDEKDETYFE